MIIGNKMKPMLPSTTRWLRAAKIKLKVRPAYAHSLILGCKLGITSAVAPNTLQTISAYAK